MEISKYFHVFCNYSQNYILIRTFHNSLPKKSNKHFHSQYCSCLRWLYVWISQTQLIFLYTVQLGPITDMQTYKLLHLFQHLFLNILHSTLKIHPIFYAYILFIIYIYIHLLLFPFTIYALLFFYIYALLFLTTVEVEMFKLLRNSKFTFSFSTNCDI